MFFKLPDWLIYDIKSKWEHLVIRKWINQNPGIIFIITGCSMLLFLILLISFLMPSRDGAKLANIKKEWYYDLNTDRLFIDKTGLASPTAAPSGPFPNGDPAGVRAYVFSYSLEPDEKTERLIGFLEISEPNVAAENDEIKKWELGRFIRTIEDANWYQADSLEGRAILQNVFSRNKEGLQPYYYPPR